MAIPGARDSGQPPSLSRVLGAHAQVFHVPRGEACVGRLDLVRQDCGVVAAASPAAAAAVRGRGHRAAVPRPRGCARQRALTGRTRAPGPAAAYKQVSLLRTCRRRRPRDREPGC